MSRKTLRSSNASAIASTAARIPLRKLYVACAAGLLALNPCVSLGLELGNATLRSRLGEPLLLEIPYRLADGERLTPECVSLVPAPRSAGALPSYARASRVAVTPTHIRLFGDSRVLEPLIGVSVGVRCASAPNFVRSYELFVDPPSYVPAPLENPAAVASNPMPSPEAGAAAPAAAAVSSAQAPTPPRGATSPRARGETGGTLIQGQMYVVVRGDTLSGIAARVGDRPGTILATADAIFAANPAAFARGDQNLLQAGRAITIPLLTAAAAEVPPAPAPVAVPAVIDQAPVPAASPATVLPVAPASALPVPAASPIVPELPTAAEQLAIETPASRADVEPSAAPAVEPSAAPAVVDLAPVPASASGTSVLQPLWLALLSALAGAVGSAVVILWIGRRRRQELAPPRDEAKPRAAERMRIVDPMAGIDVVEGELPRVSVGSSEPPAAPAALVDAPAAATTDFDPGAPDSTAHDSVDLDVGTPTPADALADEGGDRTATLQQQTLETPTAVLVAADGAAADDEQHTLTVVELDMLRADYEAEHTLTQESSKALRDALADLKATEAERAASTDTATLQMPEQPDAESIETQPTRKLRAYR